MKNFPRFVLSAILFLQFISFENTSAQTLKWVKQIAGSGDDGIYDLALDDSLNSYVAGWFSNTADIDPGSGVVNLTSAGSRDILIAKYDSSGNFVWGHGMGGADQDEGSRITLDQQKNVIVGGRFSDSFDFDPGAGSTVLTSNGDRDVYITKFNSNGIFQWAISFGGPGYDDCEKIVTDKNNDIYITGNFHGTVDFDPGPGVHQLVGLGADECYLAKYDSNGNFLWVIGIVSPGVDDGGGLTIDSTGYLYLTGFFSGTIDFDPGIGVSNLTSAGGADAFIAKYDTAGHYIWAKNMGGTGDDNSYGIYLHHSDLYITGRFTFTADFDPGAGVANLTSNGSTDIFLAKYDTSGNYKWAFGIGGTDVDIGNDVAVDNSGNVLLLSLYQNTCDFDPGINTTQLTSLGSYDVAISKYDSLGNYINVASIGGNSYDVSRTFILDHVGDIYLPGLFSTTCDFDPSAGIYNLPSAGSSDGFIAKYSECTTLIQPSNITGVSNICIGNTYTYSILPIAGADTYIWILPSGWTGTSSINTITVVAGLTAGTIFVFATNSCSATTPVSIVVKPSPIYQYNNVADICSGGYYIFPDGTVGNSDTIYTSNFTSVYGCDSTFTTQLIVHSNYTVINPQTICDGESYTIHSHTYSQQGTYLDTLQTLAGCDSIVITALTVNTVDTSIVISGLTLFCSQSGATYQWINCDSIFSSISGATNQSYTATINGNYAVIVSINGCTDTSPCKIINDVGIDENNFSKTIFIAPNPTQGKFIVSSSEKINSIQIYNLIGEEIINSIVNDTNYEIDLVNQSAGIYFINVNVKTGNRRLKIVKQ